MLNQQLWHNIVTFNINEPSSEYNFSIRLAKNNGWTQTFAEQAIEEYKKFMYLAAISDTMVSPSPIVDEVWHQHLIFSQSYQEFCRILGKSIQHIPATHQQDEFEKFKQAQERTARLYADTFGQAPKAIWQHKNIFDSLELEAAQISFLVFILACYVIFLCLIPCAYFILTSIYSQIASVDFMIGLLLGAIGIGVGLHSYNTQQLRALAKALPPHSFVHQLHLFEVIYLKTSQLQEVINVAIDQLITNQVIQVNPDKTLTVQQQVPHTTHSYQQQIVATLQELGTSSYPDLLQQLQKKPIFTNIPHWAKGLKKHLLETEKIMLLFGVNVLLIATVTLLALTRIITGIMRDKPVFFICLLTLGLAIGGCIFLYRLTTRLTKYLIPTLYKEQIIPEKSLENDSDWSYFLYGTSVFTASFIPLIDDYRKNKNGDGDGGDDGGDSGDSSCSSGCGGCGGGE